eukprot:gene10579-12238_t
MLQFQQQQIAIDFFPPASLPANGGSRGGTSRSRGNLAGMTIVIESSAAGRKLEITKSPEFGGRPALHLASRFSAIASAMETANKRRSSRLQDEPKKSMRDESDDEESSDPENNQENEVPKQIGRFRTLPCNPCRMEGATINILALEMQINTKETGLAKKKAAPRRAVKKAKQDAEALHSLGIFEIIAKHPDAVLRAAKEWVQEYKSNQSGATARLMSLLVQASGSDKEVEGDEVEDLDVDDLVKQLAEGVIKDGGTEPFQDRKLQKLNFRNTYGAFWDGVVSELHAAELLSNSLAMDKISNLVVALSCSTVRPFRLAATLTASLMVTAFVGVQKQLAQALAAAQFQRETESKKKGANKDIVAGLNRQVDLYHRRYSELKEMVANLTTSIFAVRFRDVSDEIRVITVSSVASWIKLLPDTFLVDAHLKYLGWALSDKDAPVRLAAVTGVLQLFSEPENTMPMRDFKGRFLERFKELPYDVDELVAIKGLELLLAQLVTVGELEHESLELLAQLVTVGELDYEFLELLAQLVTVGELEHESVRAFSSFLADPSHDIRHASAALMAQLLHHSSEQKVKEVQAAAAVSPSARGKKASKAQAAKKKQADPEKLAKSCGLAAVLEMMDTLCDASRPTVAVQATPIKQLLHHRGTRTQPSGPVALDRDVVELLVDALFDKLPVLHDWSSITTALLDDDLMEGRGHIGHIHLVLLLGAAVERVQQGSKHSGAAATIKKGPRSKSSAPNTDAHQEATLILINLLPALLRKYQTAAAVDATLILMKLLPALLRKYQTVAAVIAPLLCLVRYMKLELYSLKQEEKSFSELLGLVSDQLFKYADSEEVVVEAVSTLVFTAKEGPSSLQPAAQLVLSEAVSKASTQLVAAAKAVQSLSKDDLAEEVVDLGEGKIPDAEELYNLKCTLQRVALLLLNFLLEDAHTSGRMLGAETLSCAISASYSILLWELVQAKADSEHHKSSEPLPSVADLSSHLTKFMDVLVGLHSASEGDDATRDTIFQALADIGTPLEPAAITDLSDSTIRQLWSQCAAILNRPASAFTLSPQEVKRSRNKQGNR